MPAVTVNVEPWPYNTATGLEVEEKTSYGWVEVLDTASIGTYPNHTASYAVTAFSNSYVFRYRWKLGGSRSDWYHPLSVPVAATAEIEERLTQAVLAKAIRIYALAESPLGTHGELNEFGMARVMPDYQIQELLAGLGRVNWDVDIAALVVADDVVRTMGYESLEASKTTDITRAIAAASSWVAEYVLGQVAIA